MALRCLCLLALLSSSALARPARSNLAARALPSDHPDYVGLVVLDEVDFPVPNPVAPRLVRRHKPSATPTTTHHPHHHHHTQPTGTATKSSQSGTPTPGICQDFGLIANGGLELDAANGPFYAWTPASSGPGASGLTLSDSSGSCYSGDKCFTVTNTAVPSADALTPWQADFTQTFDVKKGRQYLVSFASKGPGDTNAKVEVDVTFTTKDGAVVSSPAVPVVYPPSVWTVTTFQISAPSDCPDDSGLTATVDVKFIGETCIQDQVVAVDCVGVKEI